MPTQAQPGHDQVTPIIPLFPTVIEETIDEPTQPTTTQAANPITPTLIADHVQLVATVWADLPQVPVLMYHRFNPVPGTWSSRYTTNLADFEYQLKSLHEAGFSLISIEDWLIGNINVPEGRRPLIITIDDLFYGDQISLNANGEPARYSGVGFLWHFSQAHPDFNFEVALFYNMGDKGYANHYENGVFSFRDGWRQSRAEVIAWSVENGAMPLNHFYEHPFLNQLNPTQIHWQIEQNDLALREALRMAGREDLINKLPNILALPYVVWPATEAGKQVLFDYVNPEGIPVAAIMEGDYAGGVKYLPSPFSPEFNRWRVPRVSASSQSIAGIVNEKDRFPTASSCPLGEFWDNPHMLPDVLAEAILSQIHAGICPHGVYLVKGYVFIAHHDVVLQFTP